VLLQPLLCLFINTSS